MNQNHEIIPGEDDQIAIVGMAGRFPGAANVDELWKLSLNGESGLSQVTQRKSGDVTVRGVVGDADRFDADYFGIPAHESAMMDRQQRLLLEVAQHAFDDANVDRAQAGTVAVYAACASQPTARADGSLSDRYQQQLASEAGFAGTRLAYRLGLKGEAITVETACSSSLTAVHLAVQSLLSGQCDAALAGGASIPLDQEEGYATEEGMITSPTGQCRPFDIEADGTVPGAGAAMVLLKRLGDAVRDGDRIRAVIRGTAANNDGATKVGFMAPSPEGQAEAIAMAHAVAGIPAGSIGYVETHGTATKLGDAAEIEGLRRSFGLDPDRTHACFLGSLKANCGHLDRAAGVAGLVRAALALQHRMIPPMACFNRPNPALGLDAPDFAVPEKAMPWPTGVHPRRAGVSAFGVGGTNVHVVLEESPVRRPETAEPTAMPVLLPLSAHSSKATRKLAEDLARQLERSPKTDLRGTARALATGRTIGKYRSWIVAASAREAAQKLRKLPPTTACGSSPTVVFEFPGQGAPFVDGLPDLYASEPVFQAAIDEFGHVLARYGVDLKSDLYADLDDRESRFQDTRKFQPAMVAVELALTRLWASWGVTPEVVLGHSLGEVSAAGAAGVLDLADVLALVAQRAAAMSETRPGANLSIALSPDHLRRILPDDVVISTVNGAQLTTVTGPPGQIEVLADRLAADGVFFKRLNMHTSPHSPAMGTAAATLRDAMTGLCVNLPSAQVLSNVTGGWANESFGHPDYWHDHLVSQVRFADLLQIVASLPSPLVLSVGPDEGLSRMTDHEIGACVRAVIPSAGKPGVPGNPHAGRRAMLEAAGRAWSEGVPVDLGQVVPDVPRESLPLTPFDHERIWARPTAVRESASAASPDRRDDCGTWLYEATFASRNPSAGQQSSRPLRPTAWVGKDDGLREKISTLLADLGINLQSYEEAAADAGQPLDVLWRLGHSDNDNLLTDAWRLASELAENHPGSRVWILTRPRPTSGGMPAPADLAVGVIRVLPQELPGTQWRLVRLGGGASAGTLVDVLSDPPAGPVLELDGGGLRELSFEQAWPDWRARPVREDGCYVITGGLGLVGRALATAIAQAARARIIITGRRPASGSQTEIDALAEAIGSLGSRLTYVQADVADVDQVRNLFSRLRAAYGRIDGVIHAAGLTDRDQFTVLKDTTKRKVREVALAKVSGCVNLATALNDEDADFVLLCSSLSVALGGLRFGAYVAANAALDEFARVRHAQGDRRWISVAWDAWSERVKPDAAGPARYALIPEDAPEILRRLLSVRGPVVCVSTGDLCARMAAVAAQIEQPDLQAETRRQSLPSLGPGGVRAVLTEILGSVPDDPEQDLRTAGVESLTVLQIVTRLQGTLGTRIPLGEAFGALSVAGLEDLVSRCQGTTESGSPGRPAAEMSPAAALAEGQHPVSAVQKRWLNLLEERYGGLDLVVEVQAECTAKRLAEAIEQVVDRHSGLRTIFQRRSRDTGNEWTQSITTGCEVQVIDLTGLPTSKQEAKLSALATANAERWFAPTVRPPFEVTVVGLEPRRNALVIHAYHGVFDGWSSSIFLRDVARALKGELTGRAPQYTDHARAHVSYLQSTQAQMDAEYWKKHFAGAVGPTRIPPDHSNPSSADAARTDHGAMLELSFGPRLATRLNDVAAQEDVTAFALMMSAYGMLVHTLTRGATDVIVGTTAAGRPTLESEETVGVFVSPLPLRLAVHGEQSLRSLVRATHDTLVGLHEHGQLPLTELTRQVEPFIGLGPNDTFHCYLLYQNYWKPSERDIDFRRMALQDEPQHRLMREFEIVLEQGPKALSGELWYLPSRFSAESAAAWGELYSALLTHIGDPGILDSNVSDFISSVSRGPYARKGA